MRKIDVLSLLSLLVGGLLSLGDGMVVGVPLLAASAYVLARAKLDPTRNRLTATRNRLTAVVATVTALAG
ncbi:hypothetical protein [Halorussus lipolyticus]|uniref:hypothetical protein n=1 Tax=Halorussus lipolyticus TaxID=3034024 RepID=UPI0023E8CB7F|nr:hypothetical protein [Halorussus sp. DT80]